MYGKGIAVVVRNIETKENREYTTINEAARALKVTPQALSKRFKKKSTFVFKGQYQVEKKIVSSETKAKIIIGPCKRLRAGGDRK